MRTRSALATLGPVELAGVLEELLRARPELRADAERIAREQLAGADLEAVAEQVEWELRSLSSDELNGRAGRQRWGYVEPIEAAWELLGETVAAHDREIERLIALGMIAAALDTALGVIAGLYRCRGRDDGDLLLSWAPDFLLEHADSVVDDLAKARIEEPPELVADIAPDWAASLTGPRRPGR
ncbi:MAG: hypothetical protein ACLP0J_05575 [Solirubrobacteraceae bacterium]